MSGWDNAHKRGKSSPLDRHSLRADEAYQGMVKRSKPEPDPKPARPRPRRCGMNGQWNKKVYGA